MKKSGLMIIGFLAVVVAAASYAIYLIWQMSSVGEYLEEQLEEKEDDMFNSNGQSHEPESDIEQVETKGRTEA